MMYGIGAWGWSFALMHFFAGLLMIAFLVGIVFFLAWAIKTLKKEQLLHWGILLVVVSAIGCVLAVSLVSFVPGGVGPNRTWNMMWGPYDIDGK